MSLITQPSKVPTRKVAAAALGGAIGMPAATIFAWLLTYQGVEMPAEVTAAIGSLTSTLLGFVAAYFTRDRF